MKKPNNYDSINIGFTPVIPADHKCEIKNLEETKSKTGLDMFVISFDMDTSDPQGGYYRDRYLEDKAAGKEPTWRGRMWLVVDESTQYGPANLKRFCTAIEESNDGFEIVWGDGFAAALKGKKIGILFREEEYRKDNGDIGVSVKPFRFCNYHTANLQNTTNRKAVELSPADEGFMKIDSLSDDGLPFN